jgi:hypothetical protein
MRRFGSPEGAYRGPTRRQPEESTCPKEIPHMPGHRLNRVN